MPVRCGSWPMPACAFRSSPSPTSAGTGSSVSFAATQVLVDNSVLGLGIDVVSGVVSARSGNTLGIEDATLTQNGGTVTFLPGTTIVNIGPNTLITAFGQGVAAAIGPQEISVGSSIEAFGTATQTTATQTSTANGTSGVVLDASTGRVRLDLTTAQGLVTAQGAAALTLNLTSLGGRSISAFDFNGSGAAPNQYAVATQQGLDLTNAIVGAPVVVTGFPSAFGSTSPNYTASTLLDPTTIQAELVVDWNGGTAAPFTSFGSFNRTQSYARTTQHAGQASGPASSRSARRRRPPDAQLSAPVLHLPASFPGAPLLSAVCL